MNAFAHRLLVACFLSGLTVGGAAAQTPPPGDSRPNILLLVADDMGFSDIGSYGGEIATPNLDRLAAGGVRFTQFYNNTRCSPSRASLLTGLYAQQAGVGEVVDRPKPDGYLSYITRRAVTIAEVLGEAGYATFASGKWHLGREHPHQPIDRGFDRFYGHLNCCSNYFGRPYHEGFDRLNAVWAVDDSVFTPPAEGFYATDAFTDAALRFIDEGRDDEQPFFIYMAYTAPHWPLHALPEDIAKYKGAYDAGWEVVRQRRYERLVESGIIDSAWALPPLDVHAPDMVIPPWDALSPEMQEKWALRMEVYAAMVDRLDQNIGRIMDKLEERGEADNTLVLFLSDNGATDEEIGSRSPVPPGGRTSYMGQGGPWAQVSNAPFRLFKHWVHEGGIATPLIARWPDVIESPDRLYRHPAHVIDVMATAVEVAGARYPEVYDGRLIQPLEGRSLVPALKGDTAAVHQALFWEHQGNRAVRHGKWKLVERYPHGWELYDMEADRTELRDLSRERPETVALLAQLYETWASRANVQPWPFGPYELGDPYMELRYETAAGSE